MYLEAIHLKLRKIEKKYGQADIGLYATNSFSESCQSILNLWIYSSIWSVWFQINKNMCVILQCWMQYRVIFAVLLLSNICIFYGKKINKKCSPSHNEPIKQQMYSTRYMEALKHRSGLPLIYWSTFYSWWLRQSSKVPCGYLWSEQLT